MPKEETSHWTWTSSHFCSSNSGGAQTCKNRKKKAGGSAAGNDIPVELSGSSYSETPSPKASNPNKNVANRVNLGTANKAHWKKALNTPTKTSEQPFLDFLF